MLLPVVSVPIVCPREGSQAICTLIEVRLKVSLVSLVLTIMPEKGALRREAFLARLASKSFPWSI